ncbi:hypothetical protein KJ765_03560 [Candidatus Micrarchaeota archaeon]|nr:hypothetical protein [Candidatus Micrarchaeota archaeon]
MNKKALSYALILFGVGGLVLALAQVNQLMVSTAQSEVAMMGLEETLNQQEELAAMQGLTPSEIAATSQQARSLVGQSIAKVNNAYMQGALVNLVIGVIFIAAGIFIHPR